MNLDTLEMRLHNIIKRPSLINQNQQYPQIVNNSSPIGAMIPTPGMSHSGNSNMMVTSSMDASMISSSGVNSIAPNNVNTGNMLPTGGLPGGSFNRSDGTIDFHASFVLLVLFALDQCYRICFFRSSVKWISAVFCQFLGWSWRKYVFNECAKGYKPDDSYSWV